MSRKKVMADPDVVANKTVVAAEKAVKKTAKAVETAAEATAEKVEKAAKAAAKKASQKKASVKKKMTEKLAAVKPEDIQPIEAFAKKVEEKSVEAAETAKTVVETVVEKAAEAVETVKEAVEAAPVVEEPAKEAVEAAPVVEEPAKEAVEAAPVVEEPAKEAVEAAPVVEEPAKEAELPQPRRSVAFIGSECYPFIKTGGLGDVMYALPRALIPQNCDVKVILPRYKCIPQKWQEKMIYRGAFQMDLCSDGRSFYVGIMEYIQDGVVYDFIDNEEFFSNGNPYTNLVDDIPKFCYFAKAALAALNYMNWVPDIIHCHDWQAALVPVYLKTLFANTQLAGAKTILTIHNLRFQGVYNIPTLKYWTGLPDSVFNIDVFKTGYQDANMLKAGLAYADMITTVSNTYAGEIQTPFYGDGLDAHLRHHSYKLRGIVNGIDVEQWDPMTDSKLEKGYNAETVLLDKKANKRALQEQLGLDVDDHKYVIGLISRLTDQKGLDLVNAILPQLIDGNTQVVVLGTGDPRYEDSFRYFENAYKGSVCSNIMYDEGRAHLIYAGSDALLVPSLFEPCGLTQLIAMRYGTVPIVRETGGLKDTVQPYNQYTDEGNGFTFDRYETGLLLDAINRSKTVYFTDRARWDEMVVRDMQKDVSWENSAKQYAELYRELKP